MCGEITWHLHNFRQTKSHLKNKYFFKSFCWSFFKSRYNCFRCLQTAFQRKRLRKLQWQNRRLLYVCQVFIRSYDKGGVLVKMFGALRSPEYDTLSQTTRFESEVVSKVEIRQYMFIYISKKGSLIVKKVIVHHRV